MSIAFVATDLWPGANFEFDENAFLPLNEGDVLIAFLAGFSTDVPDPPAGWTELSSSPATLAGSPPPSFTWLWAYVHVIGPGDTGIYDFTNEADLDSSGWSANFIEYSGLDLVNPTGDNSASGSVETDTLTLGSVIPTRTGSWLLVGIVNQTTSQPVLDGFTERNDSGPMYLLDKAALVAPSGDIIATTTGEGADWSMGILVVLQPPLEPGQRFDCMVIDSQIN